MSILVSEPSASAAPYVWLGGESNSMASQSPVSKVEAMHIMQTQPYPMDSHTCGDDVWRTDHMDQSIPPDEEDWNVYEEPHASSAGQTMTTSTPRPEASLTVTSDRMDLDIDEDWSPHQEPGELAAAAAAMLDESLSPR